MKATKDSAGRAVTFVCRYLSHSAGKNLTRKEADTLTAGGIWMAVVWETTADRALSGKAGGIADAKEALRQATVCGMPDDRPIYFAVDWDASASQQSAINQYLIGCASVLGVDRVGLYAGYGPITRAFSAGVIAWGWQTYAWSGGELSTKAQLYQYSNGHTVGGIGCDYNHGLHDDFGQWKVGESFMAISDADALKIAKAVWGTDNIIPAADSGANPANAFWAPSFHVSDMGTRVRALQKALTGSSGSVDTSAVVAGVLAGLNPTALADAIATQMGPDVAASVLDALKARLES
jgi:hypothetical protein